MDYMSRYIIKTERVPARIVDTLNKYLEIGKRVFNKYSNSSPQIPDSELLTDIYEFSVELNQSLQSTLLCYEYEADLDRYVCWFRGNMGSRFNMFILSLLRRFVGESNITTDANREYELVLDDSTIESINIVYDISEEELSLYLKMLNIY